MIKEEVADLIEVTSLDGFEDSLKRVLDIFKIDKPFIESLSNDPLSKENFIHDVSLILNDRSYFAKFCESDAAKSPILQEVLQNVAKRRDPYNNSRIFIFRKFWDLKKFIDATKEFTEDDFTKKQLSRFIEEQSKNNANIQDWCETAPKVIRSLKMFYEIPTLKKIF